MVKNKGGRPTVVTEEVLKKLEEAFALDCTILEACFYADISEKTYYNYTEKHPEFLQRVQALRQNPVLKARISVIDGFEKDPNLALKYLERKAKSEFSPREEKQFLDGDGKPTDNVLKVEFVNKKGE